jgi:transposase InsO family protein
VTRVIVLGWPVATAAEAQGISRATAYKWIRRFRTEGSPGLADRTSRPHRSPRATPAAEVARILAARTEWRWGPDRLGPLTGHPASTVAAVLRRERVPRLADLDRPTGLPVRRYEACHPGALVHQDHKKLGRIPDGGGHRALGRARAPRSHHAGLGYDHFEVIVDDRSRRGVVVPVADESGPSAAVALEIALAAFEADGIEVERVMTDNAGAYRSAAYRAARGSRPQTHTRPYRPQTNGKAERFIGTLVREWAYGRTYTTNAARLAALPTFVDFYNHRRPHTALGGLSPAAVVNNVHGDHN